MEESFCILSNDDVSLKINHYKNVNDNDNDNDNNNEEQEQEQEQWRDRNRDRRRRRRMREKKRTCCILFIDNFSHKKKPYDTNTMAITKIRRRIIRFIIGSRYNNMGGDIIVQRSDLETCE